MGVSAQDLEPVGCVSETNGTFATLEAQQRCFGSRQRAVGKVPVAWGPLLMARSKQASELSLWCAAQLA